MQLFLFSLTWLMMMLMLMILSVSSPSSKPQLANSGFRVVQRVVTVREEDQLETIPVFQLNGTFFKVGGLFPLTTTVQSHVYNPGVQQFEAFKCAINNVNAQTDFLNTTILVYTVIDTQGSESSALAATIDLIRSNNTMIIGPSSTNEAYQTALYSTDFNVSVISYASSSIKIQANSFTSYLNLMIGDSVQSLAMNAIMRELDWNLVTPLFTNDSYGDSARNAFHIAGKGRNVSYICETVVPTVNTIDDIPFTRASIQDISDCIANSIVTGVVLFMDLINAANVISVLKNNPLNDRLVFIGSSDWMVFTEEPYFFSEITGIPISFLEGTIGLIPSPGDQTSFKRCFYNLSPTNNNYSVFLQFWEESFQCYLTDTPTLLLPCPDDLRMRNLSVTPCLCTGQENLSQVLIDPSVAYVQDSVYFFADALHRIITNCESILFANYCGLTNVSGSQIYDVMQHYPINGFTGDLSFNSDIRNNGAFDVIQIDKYGSYTKVGSFDNLNLTLNKSLLQFKTPGAIPISAITLDTPNLSSAAGIIVFTLALLESAVFIVTMVYVYKYRRNKIIKRSSPVFCELVLLGMVLVNLGLVIWTFDQTQWTCIVKIWVIFIGFGLIVGNLLAKTYRILKIFTNIRVHSRTVKDRQLFKFSCAIILFEVALLSIYTFATGLPQPVLFVNPVSYTYSYISCELQNDQFQLAMTIVLLLFNFLLIVLMGAIAFYGRKVHSSFNESVYIGATVYSYIILVLIAIPLYYDNPGNSYSATRQYVVRSMAIIIALAFTWVALFGSKFRMIYTLGNHRWSSLFHHESTTGSASSQPIS